MKRGIEDAAAPRERILEAAAEMFYNEGIRGSGVEAIALAARTTKMAIYRHWASKDELVVEWLRGVTREYSAVLDTFELQHSEDPRAQLRGFVRFASDSLYKVSYRGCPFANSIAELPDRNHPARQLIEAHKVRQARRLANLCKQAGIPRPKEAAAELTFLLEGAQVTAQNRGISNSDKLVSSLALAVVDRCVADDSKARAPLRSQKASKTRVARPPLVSPRPF